MCETIYVLRWYSKCIKGERKVIDGLILSKIEKTNKAKSDPNFIMDKANHGNP
jgi:hypothetical protein